MPPRNNIVDMAKGLGIILIVLGHNQIVQHDKGELFRIIYSFHIPLFFFLSGVFLKKHENLKNFISSKADALLKPYLVVLASYGVAIIAFGSTSFVKYFVRVIYATGGTIPWVWEPLWFLPNLFVSSLFTWMILRATNDIHDKNFRCIIIFTLLAVGATFIDIFCKVDLSIFGGPNTLSGKPAYLPGLPFSLDIVCISSSFLLLGYFMRQQVKAMKFQPIYFIIAVLVFCVLHYLFDQTIDLNMRLYGNILISSLQAISGIYIIISFSALLSSYARFERPLAYIGSSSLFIFIFHSILQIKALSILSQLCETEYLNWLITLFIGVIFPIILLEITRRQRLLSAMLLPRKSNPWSQHTSTGLH